MAGIYDRVALMQLQRGRKDKFWRGETKGTTLTIRSGDVGTPGQSETRTYATLYEAADALVQEELDKLRRGYLGIPPKQLRELTKATARSSTKAAARKKEESGSRRNTLSGHYETTPVERKSIPAAARSTSRGQKRDGPYKKALTGPTIFRPKFRAPKARASRGSPPRATSGGRPILAEGQPWPVCGFCDGAPMGLYLQFDIEERFMLAFAPGSHFLLFHCNRHSAVPDMPRDLVLPKSWLDVNHESSYRIVLNPPTAREVAHPVDPSMLEQRISFSSSKETVAKGPDGQIGAEMLKIGGLPHWVQPPIYPRCACGARMGFILQVPARGTPGWKTRNRKPAPFAGGLDAFIFACSVQSHPYAAIMMVQR